MNDVTSKSEVLRNFILQNLPYLRHTGGGGIGISHPEFELYARDYIAFAEKELTAQDERSRINCVSHLKRAIDCQLDQFLHVYGLANLFKKRNLKFDAKTEFLQACGVSATRTLSRLNTIRNRMEHSYEVPKVNDLEVYFDLVVTFVAALERSILILLSSEREYDIVYDNDSYADISIENSQETNSSPTKFKIAKYTFGIAYDVRTPCITASWKTKEEESCLVADTKDIKEFAYFFRVFFLLSLRNAFATDEFIVDQL